VVHAVRGAGRSQPPAGFALVALAFAVFSTSISARATRARTTGIRHGVEASCDLGKAMILCLMQMVSGTGLAECLGILDEVNALEEVFLQTLGKVSTEIHGS
jgi:hypothetical protein